MVGGARRLVLGATAALLLMPVPVGAQTRAGGGSGRAAQDDAGEIGAKLSNPVSDIWALFTEFDVFFSEGNVNRGDAQAGSRAIFQPVLPFPLYGGDDDRWSLIARPNIPIVFSQPVPTGFDDYKHKAGLADIQLPMLVAPPTGRWLLGAGPAWLFPTSTEHEFGRQQWGIGPSAVFGYMNKDVVAGVFPSTSSESVRAAIATTMSATRAT